jgi:hypothetical protein
MSINGTEFKENFGKQFLINIGLEWLKLESLFLSTDFFTFLKNLMKE